MKSQSENAVEELRRAVAEIKASEVERAEREKVRGERRAALLREQDERLIVSTSGTRLDEIDGDLKSLDREQRADDLRKAKLAKDLKSTEKDLARAIATQERAAFEDARELGRRRLEATRSTWAAWGESIAEIDKSLRELESFLRLGGAAEAMALVAQLPGGMSHMFARNERLQREAATVREEQKVRDEPARLAREAAWKDRVRKEFGADFGGELLPDEKKAPGGSSR